MRDAIILSTWSWTVNNVPERIALALALAGAKVLYCEMPVSRFRRRTAPVREIGDGIFRFCPEYLGEKFSSFRSLRSWQWKKVAQAILSQADGVGLKDPVFIYSHIRHIAPLCQRMRQSALPMVHVCMDYPEPYQYELIELSDQTWVIPRTVFKELKPRYGEGIKSIPQSIHLPSASDGSDAATPPAQWSSIERPRLGYLGPLQARVNVELMRDVLSRQPKWQFICFGGAELLPLDNVHTEAWAGADRLAGFVAGFDAGVMPYDLSDNKNLHCVPLKLFDYFAAGLPVVSTRILSLAEFEDLVYFGDTVDEFVGAVERALAEPPSSAKRQERKHVAREHSTEALAQRLAELVELLPVTSSTVPRVQASDRQG